MATKDDLKAALREVLNQEAIPADVKGGSFGSKVKDIQGGVDRIEPDVDELLNRLPAPPPV